ncbi:MAG: pilus assembly protein TadG-related protein [Gemmatirosa sp.]
MLVLVALLMVPLVVLAAFSLDVGWWQVGANQLQTSADAAALAAARALQLDVTTNPHVNTTTYASQTAASNTAFSQPVAVTAADVESRRWDPDVLGLTVTGWTDDGTNAVQVTTRTTPGLILAGVVRDSAPTISRRAVAWIANINSLACVTPWILPYSALHDRIAWLASGAPPGSGVRPPLTQRQVAALTIGNFSEASRTLMLRGPAAGVSADTSWRVRDFAGTLGYHANIQGCDSRSVSVGSAVSMTGITGDYECWTILALMGSNGVTCPSDGVASAFATQPVTCHYRDSIVAPGLTTHDAGCYDSTLSVRGVQRRVVWGDASGYRVVGTATLLCAFRGLSNPAGGRTESCSSVDSDLPIGTLAVTIHGLTTILRLQESMDFGNTVGLDQRLFLVR